jgi:hypothetical protein
MLVPEGDSELEQDWEGEYDDSGHQSSTRYRLATPPPSNQDIEQIHGNATGVEGGYEAGDGAHISNGTQCSMITAELANR